MKLLSLILTILTLTACSEKAPKSGAAVIVQTGHNLYMACMDGRCAICKSSKHSSQAMFECASALY